MPEDYAAAGEIVWRHLDRDSVTLKHPDAEPPHVAAERGEDRVAVGELDAKRGVREDFGDLSFELDWFFFRHL
jgi:hypothetical protein